MHQCRVGQRRVWKVKYYSDNNDQNIIHTSDQGKTRIGR